MAEEVVESLRPTTIPSPPPLTVIDIGGTIALGLRPGDGARAKSYNKRETVKWTCGGSNWSQSVMVVDGYTS